MLLSHDACILRTLISCSPVMPNHTFIPPLSLSVSFFLSFLSFLSKDMSILASLSLTLVSGQAILAQKKSLSWQRATSRTSQVFVLLQAAPLFHT